MHAAEIVLAALAAGVGWRVHVRIFPWKTCPRCGGSMRNRSGGAHRDCPRCGATGRVRRFTAPKN